MSTTRTVSIRTFRANMTKYLREAQEKNIHFVIMRHAVPIARIEGVSPTDSLESLIAEVAQARKEYREGKGYTVEEARKILKLRTTKK
ncbi:MAG: type II toxin-antitoxin system prevent-host-death family antitoxin [Candidatus Peregrinibacteria bacterium]